MVMLPLQTTHDVVIPLAVALLAVALTFWYWMWSRKRHKKLHGSFGVDVSKLSKAKIASEPKSAGRPVVGDDDRPKTRPATAKAKSKQKARLPASCQEAAPEKNLSSSSIPANNSSKTQSKDEDNANHSAVSDQQSEESDPDILETKDDGFAINDEPLDPDFMNQPCPERYAETFKQNYKKARQKHMQKKYAPDLDVQDEARVRQQQLDKIMALMKKNEDIYGSTGDSMMKEQFKMYCG